MSLITILRKWVRVLNPGFVSSTSVASEKLQIAPRLMDRLRVNAGVATPAGWHAELRALDGLSNATRRDLGLAERLSPLLPRADHDRARW